MSRARSYPAPGWRRGQPTIEEVLRGAWYWWNRFSDGESRILQFAIEKDPDFVPDAPDELVLGLKDYRLLLLPGRQPFNEDPREDSWWAPIVPPDVHRLEWHRVLPEMCGCCQAHVAYWFHPRHGFRCVACPKDGMTSTEF